MFSNKFNSTKCETTTRLCVGRIKLLRNKKTVQLKQSQRDIAELLRNGKQEYARIRVEGVIREKLLLQAYEILELYLELLTVRTQLIAKTKELPRDMMEAISSIIYAAQRINDLPELATLRTLFVSKYGKEYATEAAADATTAKWQVNANLIRCLLVEAPQPEDKLSMLSEIAQDNGVEWDLAAAARDMGVGAPGSAPPAAHAAGGGTLPLLPATSSGAPPGPYPHGGGGGPGGPSGPGGPGGPGGGMGMAHPQFANAQQAAHAAQQAATAAHAAAESAAQWAAMSSAAQGPPQAGAPQQGWLIQQPLVHVQSSPTPLQPPPAGSHGDLQHFAHQHQQQQQPQHGPGGSGASIARGSAPAAMPPAQPYNDVEGAHGPHGGGGGFVQRSNEDIQRAYDAALGPPAKGAPAAPPFEPTHLPTPPAAPAPPAPPPQVEDEYEELTRRLEALKKS